MKLLCDLFRRSKRLKKTLSQQHLLSRSSVELLSRGSSETLENSHPERPGCGITLYETLPPELWRNIESYLSIADKCSLASTSSTLHSYFGDQLQQLKSARKVDIHAFLLHRDKDMKSHVLCPWCARYHRLLRPQQRLGGWAHRRLEARRPDGEDNRNSRVPHQLSTVYLNHRQAIMWYDVHMVMRAYRYGIEYGNPISALEFHMECWGPWTCDSFAVIDQGRLLLKFEGIHDPILGI